MTAVSQCHVAPRSGFALRPVSIISAVLSVRWLAGIAEGYGLAGLSEKAAMAGMVVLFLLFLARLQIARGTGLLLAGFSAWIAAALLSAAANGQLGNGAAVELIGLLGFYALLANASFLHLRGPEDLAPFQALITGFIAIGATLTVSQYLTGQGFVAAGKPDLVRATGSDVHPVSFGIQVVIALAILTACRAKRGLPRHPIQAVLIGAGLVAVYLTFARTAWAMGAFTLGWAVAWGPGPARRLITLAGLVAALGFAVASGRFGDLASLPRFLVSFDLTNLAFDHRYIDNSFSWRIVNWAYGLQQALAVPILGHGPGQSAVLSAFSREMHNIVLELFFECGVAGLFALALVFGGLVHLHRQLPKKTACDRRVSRMATGLGLALMLVVMVSTSLVDQLMTIALYILFLAIARVPARPCP